MGHELLLGLVIGTLANIVAELYLAFDLTKSISRLTRAQIWCRRIRWVCCLLGCGAIGWLGLSAGVVVLFGLFSVSAATDFETCFLPPDEFVYGAVLISMVVGWLQAGWVGFCHVAIAQAACFSITVLAVRYLGACDSGDIKLGMQYGAVCGSLLNVAAGTLIFWLIACLAIVVVAVACALRARSLRAATRALNFQFPLGPLLWCGALGSLLYSHYRVGEV